MENASKAVIMAGSVLIAVAMISLALYGYAQFRGYAKSSDELLTLSQIESFNRFYQSFREGTDTIRGVDAVNIYNKAMEDGITIINMPDGLDNYTSLSNPTENFLTLYDYEITSYDFEGKVSGIRIQ